MARPLKDTVQITFRIDGHSWWTRFYDAELKVEFMLDRQRQLVLPDMGSEIVNL
jgi:hypothetical protein